MIHGTCLVTGGAGFIGSNLVRALLDRRVEVIVLDNFATGKRERLPRSPRLTVVEADLCTFAELPSIVQRCDYVFHLAAQVGNVKSIRDPEGDARANIAASVRLLSACAGTGVKKIVYASSSATFGEAVTLPIDEDHPQAPESFYALSKLTAEKYALLAHALLGVPSVCLRYFNVYGLPMERSDYAGVISIFIDRLRAGQPLTIYGDGSQFRDFVYVQDVVQANLAAAERGQPGRAYNIGTGAKTTILDLAHALCRIAGAEPRITFEPRRAGEVQRSLADIGRARAELRFEPVYDLSRGLAKIWNAASRTESGVERPAEPRELTSPRGG